LLSAIAFVNYTNNNRDFMFGAVMGGFHSWMRTEAKSVQYNLKRCSKKECYKQCRYVKFKGYVTKWPVQKPTQGTTQKHVEHHDATDI